MLNNEEYGYLEALMDRYGVGILLSAISEICAGKATHVATNWGDAHLAKQWAKLSNAVEDTTRKAEGL